MSNLVPIPLRPALRPYLARVAAEALDTARLRERIAAEQRRNAASDDVPAYWIERAEMNESAAGEARAVVNRWLGTGGY